MRSGAIRTNSHLPNTHVPVVVCRLAGIWTRGQLTAPGRPAAGGEPANPAKRGTRLEATTDRAFLVSADPPKVGAQRGLSILPGVRTGLPRPNDGSDRLGPSNRPKRVMATAQQLIAHAPSLAAFEKPSTGSTGSRVGGSTTSHRASNARRGKSHRRRILYFSRRGQTARLGGWRYD